MGGIKREREYVCVSVCVWERERDGWKTIRGWEKRIKRKEWLGGIKRERVCM